MRDWQIVAMFLRENDICGGIENCDRILLCGPSATILIFDELEISDSASFLRPLVYVVADRVLWRGSL